MSFTGISLSFAENDFINNIGNLTLLKSIIKVIQYTEKTG